MSPGSALFVTAPFATGRCQANSHRPPLQGPATNTDTEEAEKLHTNFEETRLGPVGAGGLGDLKQARARGWVTAGAEKGLCEPDGTGEVASQTCVACRQLGLRDGFGGRGDVWSMGVVCSPSGSIFLVGRAAALGFRLAMVGTLAAPKYLLQGTE